MRKLLLLLMFITSIANAQIMPFGMLNSSDATPVAVAPEIGDFYQGGIVFYIAPTPTDLNSDGVADIGLICAIEDQGKIRWNKQKNSRLDVLDARATNISAGSFNTAAIITIHGGGTQYAAGLAKAYNGGGFNDWFLPSKDGLNEIYINQKIINTASLANGGAALVSGYRWSSTQYESSYQAWQITFGSCTTGCDSYKNTNNEYNVRAVRAFTNSTSAPDAPTNVTATAGNTKARVTFTAPTSNGGSAITEYTATSTPGGFTGILAQALGGSITVTGLTNGTAYTFNVTATNAMGTSGPSLDSSPVTPATSAPDAPTNVTATAGDSEATVRFTAPTSDGGSAITEYTATSTPGGFTGILAQAVGGSITVTGLTKGTAYTFNVTATNAMGTSGPSLGSSPVTPATVPDAPTNITATAGYTQATVRFTAPTSDGGSAITEYTATSTPGGFTATLSQAAGGSIIVTGLTKGTAYTFNVTATNAMGTSAPSLESDEIIPVDLAVGDFYQGGIVAYINKAGDDRYVSGKETGIIVAIEDNDTIASWYTQRPDYIDYDVFFCLACVDIDNFIGAGQENTENIYNFYNNLEGTRISTSIFGIIQSYNFDGYSDWYIPSLDELKTLYQNRVAIGNFDLEEEYWSSNDYYQEIFVDGVRTPAPFRAKTLNFNTGLEEDRLKNREAKFRAIRYF